MSEPASAGPPATRVDNTPPHPVFVGGTGRSGTHAVAKLLGRHSQYFYVSRELRFHTDRGGYPDLLSGRIDRDHFIANMRDYYWERPGVDGRARGLRNKFKKRSFEEALEQFGAAYERSPEAAAAALLSALLDPLAAAEGKPSWIEQTPQTAAAATTLYSIFPGMKLIHMVRDGRDVASSLGGQWWGPNSMRGGLKWWERRLREAHGGTSGVPAEQVLVLGLEDLIVGDREASYARLLNFLAIDDERKIRKNFDKHLSPANAHVGRWREGMSARRARRVDRAYIAALERLHADGIDSAPDPAELLAATD